MDKHKESLRVVGVLQECGGGPFGIQHSDTDNHEEIELLHWATRSEALKELHEENEHKDNRAVALSLTLEKMA